MNRLAIGFMTLLFALGTAQVQAATTKVRYTTIVGTASAPTPGQCTEGYANQCPSGSCSCVQIPSATIGKVPLQPIIAGLGTADLFVTLDNGAATVSASGRCTPFFGVAELSTTRGGKASSETLNLNGVDCSPLTGTDSPVLGGFGISASPAPINGGKGFGKIGGVLDTAGTGKVSLKLHGPITE